jgi:DNA (cytosine-5)-methyltransferase 1
MNGLDLFSGIGGVTIALDSYAKPIAYCEIDLYCQSVLLQRMQEGHLPKAPIWDDIRTLPTNELPPVDIVYGGFPCQDISVAGHGIGLEGKRSGLFFEVLRIIDSVKAPFLFLENVPNIRTKGAERVCKELAERGYDCRWCCLSASDVGARHKRERWWLLSRSPSFGFLQGASKGIYSQWATSEHEKSGNVCQEIPNPECEGLEGQCKPKRVQKTHTDFSDACDWSVEPDVGRVVDGLPHRVDRIKTLGNAVVPLCARKAFEILVGISK